MWAAALIIVLAGIPAVFLGCSHQLARLDFEDPDDAFTVGKSIGLIPKSREVYAESVGLVDPTLYYQAIVTPSEVKWLASALEVTQFEAPASAPLWWRMGLWADGFSADMKYFRTTDKWPCIYAYSTKKGVIYGTVEFE